MISMKGVIILILQKIYSCCIFSSVVQYTHEDYHGPNDTADDKKDMTFYPRELD